MHENLSRFLIIAFILVSTGMLLAAGCMSRENTTPVTPQVDTTTPAVTGAAAQPATTTGIPSSPAAPAASGQRETIRISGSTTVFPIVQKAADEYMATHPDADIQISGGGSGVGIQAIGAKTVDIGISSRDVTADEMKKYPSFVVTPIAHDGIAIIVNPANTIQNITLDQVRNIYLGKTTGWTEIAGANVPGTNNQIVVIGRDSASGTRTYFDETILSKASPVKQMLEKNSNGAVLQTVDQTPGAIGYVSIGFISTDVRALPIRFNESQIVAPSLASVKDKSYPISRDLYVITNGQPAGLTGDFIRYILSPDGQKIVADEGYVTVS